MAINPPGYHSNFSDDVLLSLGADAYTPAYTPQVPSAPPQEPEELDCLALLGKDEKIQDPPPYVDLLPPSSNPPDLARQIKEKLDSIGEAIAEGKATEISMDSLDTLAVQVRTLQSQKENQKKGSELFTTLAQIYDIISMAHIRAASAVKLLPLIGPMCTLKEVADTYSNCAVKTGLNNLDSILLMRRIRGDGHCLFRSFLARLLEKWLNSKPAERNKALQRLALAVLSLNKPSLLDKHQFFWHTIQNAVATKRPFDAIVAEEKISDKLVSFLRDLTCEYNRKHGNDVFQSFVVISGMSQDAYLADMMRMDDNPTYGDHPEVQALCNIFDMNICVADVAASGKNTDPAKRGRAFRQFSAHEGIMDVFLLRFPDHYNWGLLRNQVKLMQKENTVAPEEPVEATGTKAIIGHAIKMGYIKV